MKTYAGIGSRETPVRVLEAMRRCAQTLGRAGFTLRSGGAGGADTTFEKGCDDVQGEKEIYIPWNGFGAKGTGSTGGSRNNAQLGVHVLKDHRESSRRSQANTGMHRSAHGRDCAKRREN